MDLLTLADRTEWADAPLDPSWVRGGSPRARVQDLETARSGRTIVALWECSAGEFVWHYGLDETVHVLSGGMRLRFENGAQRVVGAGEVVLFEAGTSVHWTIEDHVRKLAVLHDLRGPFRRAADRLVAGIRAAAGPTPR